MCVCEVDGVMWVWVCDVVITNLIFVVDIYWWMYGERFL